MSLAEQIELARKAIEGWPNDVRIAMGIEPRAADEPPAAQPMPFKNWVVDIRTQSLQRTTQAYRAKIQKLEYELACRPSEPPAGALRSIVAEMIAVAAKESTDADEWTAHCRSRVDSWQVRIADSICGRAQPPTDALRTARLEWAMACHCMCDACATLHDRLQAMCGDAPTKSVRRCACGDPLPDDWSFSKCARCFPVEPSSTHELVETNRNGVFSNCGYHGTASGWIVRDGTFWVATFRGNQEANQYVSFRNAEPPPDVQRDAERWRALIGCARITAMGSAGIVMPDAFTPNYAHLTVNLWTVHPTRETDRYSREWLQTFADIAVRARAEAAPGRVFSEAESDQHAQRLLQTTSVAEQLPSPALDNYDIAMMAAGVPHEPVEVYDSNSWRRVGLKRHYEERLYPYVMRDGQPDIRGTDLLRAMVAAFNCMLELRPREK